MITEMIDYTSDGTTITVEVMKEGSVYVHTGTLLVENYENGDGKKQFNEYTLGRPCGDEWLKYLNDYEEVYSWTVTDKLHPEEYLDDF